MAISKLPLSPFRQDTRIFPTPLSSDVLFSELRDCTRTEIPAYGTAHPDSKKWPDHKLVFVKQVEADQREGLFEFYYAADRANQDLYNFSTGFSNIGGREGDRNYRIITRIYVTPRAEYDPVDIPFGTAMPDVPKGMFEKDEYIFFDKEQQKTDQPELDSLYVIEAHRYIERSLLDDIPSFEKERPDVIPEKFRAEYPTLRTDRIVEGQAEEPTLDADDLAVTEKQINPDVKLVTNISRGGLTDTVTLSGEQAYVETTTASVTETLTTSPELETGLHVVESKTTPLGDGNFVVQTVKVQDWPELTRSEWDPLLNSPILTKRTFVDPPSESDLQTPFTSFEPVNEDRYLKQTEVPPADGLSSYRFTFPSRTNLDLPSVLLNVEVLYNTSESKGSSNSKSTSDNLSSSGSSSGNIAYSLSTGGSSSSSSSSMPEFVITTQRIWGRDLKVNNHIFFINKGGEESLSNTNFTEEEVIEATQQKFYGGPIEYFDARPNTIREGESTEIVWSAPLSESVKLNGTAVAKQGTTGSLSPTTNTTYTLETVSNGKTESQTITVTVAPSTETLISKFDASNTVAKKRDVISLFYGTDLASAGGSLLKAKSLDVDSSGNIYFVDSYAVRKCTQAGVVTTIAGSATVSGYVDNTGPAARFLNPKGICVAPNGNVYVVDEHRIRQVTPAGVVTTFAGGEEGYVNNADKSLAKFRNPTDIVFDSSSNAYITDTGNHAIRKISSGGAVTTFAGSLTGTDSGLVNSTTASSVRFLLPQTIDIDESGADFILYVSEYYNRALRKITTTSGNFTQSFTTVSNKTVRGVAIDGSDVYYATDNGYIYKISGSTTTVITYGDTRVGAGSVEYWMTVYGGYVFCGVFSILKIDLAAPVIFTTNPEGYRLASNVTAIAGASSSSIFATGFRDGTGVFSVSVKITADDPDFSFLLDGNPLKGLPVWAQPKPTNLGLSGEVVVNVEKTTTFTLTVESGGVTKTRSLTVYVYANAEKINPWPVFKTSSGRAIGVGRSVSQTSSYSKSQSDAVSESSVFRARSWSTSYSYSTDTKVTVTEISNVLTKGFSISNTTNITPTSVNNITDSDPYNSASRSITHRDQGARATAGVIVPPSSPQDIPRGGLYLIDYKIEYYKWGWFRCITTILDAAQFK
jgi:streptogramin lyase